jgi:hypothetical protein
MKSLQAALKELKTETRATNFIKEMEHHNVQFISLVSEGEDYPVENPANIVNKKIALKKMIKLINSLEEGERLYHRYYGIV